ncbi:MAG: response regulator, partial [Thermodesulfobacteriota bacterium]|nr:response regulator [Thermodesulfobacteriota bacterium]
ELKQRQDQLENLNKELEDTNRGIVALYGELDEKAAHLVRANDLKTRFLSNMSHELRTPINSILSLSRLLLEHVNGELAPEQEKQVMFIKNAAEDLSEIINDLLDIAKIEAGKVEVHSAEFDVATLFSTLRGMLKPMLVNPGVELVIEEPESIPTMKSDEGKISQILRNLVSNAIKFTEQGEIRVTAKTDADVKSVIFAVSDTGIGISSEFHEKIFEEYTQVKTPLHKKVKGTGLGLPLSKELAGLLGGRLLVQSTPGEGSVFSAIIPLVYSGITGKIQKPAIVDVTKFSVLIIEDDEEMLFLYDKFLKGSGFQVFPARNLSEARQSLTEFDPLVIILDILLKDESGWDFIAELKSNDETREIPIIVATILDDCERGFTLGIEDFATKPIERKWLLAKLKDLAQHMPVEKLLVVDDEEVARYILKGILVDTKYTVMEAPGGEECLKIAQTERPDIIFLDLMMPGMDGFETVTKLKASPETRDIPVIVVTSKILDEAERCILKKNTLAVISKETTSRELIIESIRDAISRITDRKKSREKS